jgi:hypothetical protein
VRENVSDPFPVLVTVTAMFAVPVESAACVVDVGETVTPTLWLTVVITVLEVAAGIKEPEVE